MNRFDLLETLMDKADAYEILYQLVSNMGNKEAISLLEQAAIDMGIEDYDGDEDDYYNDYENFEDEED